MNNLSKFKKFKVYCPSSTKNYTHLNDDGTLTITGVISTTNQDLDGDIVSPQALESLKNQVVGLNLHMDHDHSYNGGIGVITDSYIENQQVYITATILSDHAPGILKRLNLGMKFGFSIGGLPVVNHINPQIIEDFVLLEVSLTLLPANWDTFGTVEAKGVVKSKCLTGACHYILKNSEEVMRKEIEENSELEQTIINIVNEAFANKEQVIIDEFRNELKPIVAEIVAEEVTPTVQEVVVNYLDELFPADPEADAEEEIVEADVDEEEIETSDATDEIAEEEEEEVESEDIEEKEAGEAEPENEEEFITEQKDETDDEDLEEKAETDEENLEEKTETDEVEEVPEEVFDEPLEIDIEKEETTEAETEEEEENEEEEAIVNEETIKSIVDRVLKELNKKSSKKIASKKQAKKVTKKPSKKDAFTKSTTKKESKSFLNSSTRDKFGRNKKYL